MATTEERRLLHGISYIPAEEIVPGPMQPRQRFSPEGLEELRDSIAVHGVLQPLTVRCRGGRYELIAGERRLRAAKMAGLREVPCVVLDADMEESGCIGLIENLQRHALDFVEEAEGISQLIRLFGLSQEQAARRLGKSQSAVANKLRLLRLPEDVLTRLRETGLSERHARALLRLPDAERQRAALDFIIDQRMTVAAAEAYIERLEKPVEAPAVRKSIFLMNDVRLFVNALERSVGMLRAAGLAARLTRQETARELVFTVLIRKNDGAAEAAADRRF